MPKTFISQKHFPSFIFLSLYEINLKANISCWIVKVFVAECPFSTASTYETRKLYYTRYAAGIGIRCGIILPDFEGSGGEGCEDGGQEPESHYNLRLGPADKMKMMMDACVSK